MAVMSVDAAAHAHDWTLQGVSYEDAGTFEEFVCASCGDVTYR